MFLGNIFDSASKGMASSEDLANSTSSQKTSEGTSAFNSDGSALNEDISFLLGMANQSGMPPEVTGAIEEQVCTMVYNAEKAHMSRLSTRMLAESYTPCVQQASCCEKLSTGENLAF